MTQAALAWQKSWQMGKAPADSPLPLVAFSLSCVLAECKQRLPLQADCRNTLLYSGDPDKLFQVLSASPGEKLAKLKVGLYEMVRDGMIVNLLLEALPDPHLRLYANRSWTLAKANGFAKYLNPVWLKRIPFLEEPCKTRDESRDLAMATDLAIAWDESVREANFVVRAEPGVAAIIIKPMLIGSVDRCWSLVEQAHAAD